MPKLIKIKGDASFRSFFRKKVNGKSSIVVYAKKEKFKNLLVYDAINKILKRDIDKDGYVDIIVSGNMYNSEIETPRNDGSVGVFLKFDPESGFQAISTKEVDCF